MYRGKHNKGLRRRLWTLRSELFGRTHYTFSPANGSTRIVSARAAANMRRVPATVRTQQTTTQKCSANCAYPSRQAVSAGRTLQKQPLQRRVNRAGFPAFPAHGRGQRTSAVSRVSPAVFTSSPAWAAAVLPAAVKRLPQPGAVRPSRPTGSTGWKFLRTGMGPL